MADAATPPLPIAEPAAPLPVAEPAAAATAGEPLAGRIPHARAGMRGRAARGTLINGAFLIGVQVLGLAKGFVVAAFISRSDYGIWGILVVALGTLVWLKQVGINDKFVQQDEADQVLAFQRAFSLEAAFTSLFWLLMIVLLPVFAVVYGHSEIILPGLIATLAMPAAILQFPLWIFYREMDFARQRRLQALDPVLSFVVTVALAVAGAGYWSLVAGMVLGAWATALLSVRACPHPLRLRFDRRTLRDYVGFSWPLALAGASGIVIAQGSIITGSHVVGLAGVGAISLASSISIYTQRLDSILTETLYPAICAVRDRADLLYESFVKSNRLALMWGMPFGVGLALFAPDLVAHVLGDRWRPATGLIQAFGLMAAVNQIGFNWDGYVRARGDTRPIAVASVLTMAAFVVAAIPLLVLDGLRGFAIGMGAMTAVALAVRFVYLTRMFESFRFLRHTLRAAGPTIPAAALVGLMRLAESGRGGRAAVLELAVYLLATLIATVVFERPLLREMLGYLRLGRVGEARA